jgi:hypothetical protein
MRLRLQADRRHVIFDLESQTTMVTLPTIHTGIDSLDYGADATEVYHTNPDCQRAQKILRDGNETFGEGGRRHCHECHTLRIRVGRRETIQRSWGSALSAEPIVLSR